LDALPMSSPQSKRREPAYATVILDGDSIVYRNKSIKRSMITKLANSWDIAYIACDNVLEIAKNGKEITQFCKTLPVETRLVQVTGNPLQGKLEKLTRLVQQYNISVPKSRSSRHFEPLIAAEAAVLLTKKGIGFVCEPFERECKITISKGRHIGPGGSSAHRYERRIRGAVRRITRDIRLLLKENTIEYDEFDLEGYQGLNKATFYVYVSLNKINLLLRSIDIGDLSQLKTERVVREELGFYPLIPETYSKRIINKIPVLIVGLDPGTTTGLAILNLHGKPLHNIYSQREFSTRQIIRKIMKYGNPILFACDVPAPPKMVEKIANSFNTPVSPIKKILPVVEKIQIANEYQERYDVTIRNSHQRDALVAAIKAFNHLKNKLDKVEDEIKLLDNTLPIEDIKMSIIHGKSLNDAISEAREIIQIQLERELKKNEIGANNHTNDPQLRRELESIREKVITQQELINRLEQAHSRFKNENHDLQKQIERLKQGLINIKRKKSLKVDELHRIRIKDAEILRLRQQVSEGKIKIESLQKDLAKLERMNTIILRDRYIPLKIINNLSQGAIEETEQVMIIIPGDVVYLRDPSGGSHRTAEELCNRQVRAIISSNPNFSHLALRVFQDNDIPIFTEEEVGAIWIDNFVLVSRDLLEKRMSFIELNRAVEAYNEEEDSLDLTEIILNYKKERRKELTQFIKVEDEETSSHEMD